MRTFAWTVAILWTVGGIAGVIYSSQQNIPNRVAAAAIFAVLLEAALYALMGFASVRGRFLRWAGLAGLLASAVAPYLVYALAAGVFDFARFAALAAVAAAVVWWYSLFARSDAGDLALCFAAGAAILLDPFKWIFPQLAPKAAVSILGHAMLLRLSIFVFVEVRGLKGIGFGFVPSRDEWRIGLRNFALFIVPGFALAYAVEFAKFRPGPWDWSKLLPAFFGTFLGMLWFVAVREELLFRGVMQPVLQRWLGSRWVGLLLTSVLFGLVHLPFRAFPNWRFAVVAALAGLFYGRAFQESGGIRAAMVTHAVVASIWRVFLV